MFANFTEETCTGTGDTLTLAGATTGNLAFSLSFADLSPVVYFVEDSGGSILIAGIGTYNSGANTITRKDLYNFNGTVAKKGPATNITLSGGTHTVRCTVLAEAIGVVNSSGENSIVHSTTNYLVDAFQTHADGTRTGFADRIYLSPFNVQAPIILSGIAIDIIVADGAATMGLALYDFVKEDRTARLIEACPNFTPSSTGVVEANFAADRFLAPGRYLFVQGQNTSDADVGGYTATNGVVGIGTRDANVGKNSGGYFKDGVFGSAVFPASVTGLAQGQTIGTSFALMAGILA